MQRESTPVHKSKYKIRWTVKKLQDFEKELVSRFEKGAIRCPLHLCGGNEKQLMDIFKGIKKQDYVFSTHRNHYHYLLKGGSPENLMGEICNLDGAIYGGQARSMNFCDPDINFYSTAIVGGGCAIAVGVALSLKKEKKGAHVWCFVGDGGEDGGHFMEAVRFALSRELPLSFIVEDNDRSTDSTRQERWHNYQPVVARNIIRYSYERVYPHVGIGKHVIF